MQSSPNGLEWLLLRDEPVWRVLTLKLQRVFDNRLSCHMCPQTIKQHVRSLSASAFSPEASSIFDDSCGWSAVSQIRQLRNVLTLTKTSHHCGASMFLRALFNQQLHVKSKLHSVFILCPAEAWRPFPLAGCVCKLFIHYLYLSSLRLWLWIHDLTTHNIMMVPLKRCTIYKSKCFRENVGFVTYQSCQS